MQACRKDTEVKLNAVVPVGFELPIYVKIFDPDHGSDDTDFDIGGSTPSDNVKASGAAGVGAGMSDPWPAPVPAGSDTYSDTMIITGRQPGNNFIIVASAGQDALNTITFAADGTTLVSPIMGGGAIPDRIRTPILTVWRTLNVEQDSLGAPSPTEFFDPPGIWYDEPVSDMGEPGVGYWSQPSLAFLTSEFSRAHVTVVALDQSLDDVSDNAAFVHNMDEATAITTGNSVRDVPDLPDFWPIQVFAEYEFREDQDNDPLFAGGSEAKTIGSTAGTEYSPINIYLETIRDVWSSDPSAQDPNTIAERVVLHETIHRFGHVPDDVGPVLYSENLRGSDEDNRLTGTMLREIMVSQQAQRTGS